MTLQSKIRPAPYYNGFALQAKLRGPLLLETLESFLQLDAERVQRH